MRLTLTDDHSSVIAAIDVTDDQWTDANDPNRRGDAETLVTRLDEARDFRCKPGTTDDPTGKCTWHPRHHWCNTCEGFYGVPHDSIHEDIPVRAAHPYGNRDVRQCACRPCRIEVIRRAYSNGVSAGTCLAAIHAEVPGLSDVGADRVLHGGWKVKN